MNISFYESSCAGEDAGPQFIARRTRSAHKTISGGDPTMMKTGAGQQLQSKIRHVSRNKKRVRFKSPQDPSGDIQQARMLGKVESPSK